jgi:hypothetical protein
MNQAYSMRDDVSEVRATSPEALAMIRRRFADPFSPTISIGGYDEMRVEHANGGMASRLVFPASFAGSRKIDVAATLHEMGHFLTVPESRCVREGFGFGGGVPQPGLDGFERVPTRPHSAFSEGKAIAWEIITMRDLFGHEPDLAASCSALRHTFDFACYPGVDEDERLEWAAGVIDGYVREFGTVGEFEALWRQRCARLPELFAREDAIRRIVCAEPKVLETISEVVGEDEWSFRIHAYHGEGLSQYEAVVACSAAEGYEDTELFDTEQACRGWIERTIAYARTVTNSPEITPGNTRTAFAP